MTSDHFQNVGGVCISKQNSDLAWASCVFCLEVLTNKRVLTNLWPRALAISFGHPSAQSGQKLKPSVVSSSKSGQMS